MDNAEHHESNSATSTPIISKLSCSLVDESQSVHIFAETSALIAYVQEQVIEMFNCNYGFNEEYRPALDKSELKVAGVDSNGDARIVELSRHRFFIATLFLPQLSSTAETPHPLIMAFVKSAAAFQHFKSVKTFKDR
jgi:CTP synthase (UTP-ammonia lyase)